jgi:hypothetical protein
MSHRRMVVEALERNLCEQMRAKTAAATAPLPTDPHARAELEFSRAYAEVVVGLPVVSTRELLARSA